MYHRFTYKGGSLWKMFFSDLSKNYQLYKKIIDTVLFALKFWSFTYAYVYTFMQYLSSVHAIVK